MRKIVAALVVGLLAVAGQVSLSPSTADARTVGQYFVDEDALPFEALPGAEATWGVHAGAGFRIEVPDDWNGDLVLYAHGFRSPDTEALTVSNPAGLRPHLIEQGYAWAASTFRANGYVPGLGAQDTHRLLQRFTSLVDKPGRVYIAGHSMGGRVTAIAVEQWPNSFDGALPMCAALGHNNELFDYFQDAYLVAETLVGNEPAAPTPPGYHTSPDGWPATAAQLGPAFPFVLNETGERYKEIIKHLTGGERPVFDQGFVGATGISFIFNAQSAQTYAGARNIDTVYRTDDGPDTELNETIIRLEALPQHRRSSGLAPFPGDHQDSAPISGDIRIPVVSIHTLGELFVPFHLLQGYAQQVADHGKSDLLVTRAIRDPNHCQFTAGEQIQAFDGLVNWVENGVRPEGDDVLDPDVVADPNYGCAFTEPTFLRTLLGVPPCL
jgi:pimeloyl-ACP methyl ester carboxylesterase